MEQDFIQTWAQITGAEKSLVRADLEGSRKKYTLNSDLFEQTFPSWKAETKKELFANILREVNPGVGEKLHTKELQALS